MSRVRLPARIWIDGGPLLHGRGRFRGLAYFASTMVDGLGRIAEAPEARLVDPVRGLDHPLEAAAALPALEEHWSVDHRAGLLRYRLAQTLYYARHPPGPGEVVLFLGHNALPLGLPARSAVVVHDLIPSAWAPWAAHRRLGPLRDRLLGLELGRATHLLTGSEATRRDLARLLGFGPSQVTVIPDSVLAPPPVAGPPSPRLAALAVRHPAFAVWLGAKELRKGLGELIEAWIRHPSGPLALVIAGLGKSYDPGIEATLARALASRPDLAAVHDLDEPEKAWLLANARVLAFSSRYEGFGLPVAEAMAVGTPSVTFDNSSLPEVCGAAGRLVPDGDFDRMVGEVRELSGDLARRAELAGRCRARAGLFTTERMARGYLEALARVAVA